MDSNNHRSSAETHSEWEQGGKRGSPVIIGLIHTDHTEANDEDEDYDEKWWGLE